MDLNNYLPSKHLPVHLKRYSARGPLPVWWHAQNVLKSLRLSGFEAYIAGGWCRDVLMGGRSVKDIDIFVMRSSGFPGVDPDEPCPIARREALREVSRAQPFLPQGPNLQLFYSGARDVIGDLVLPFTSGGLPDLNLVVLSHRISPHALAQRMDFGICQAVFLDESETFMVTREFLKDARQRTFTVVPRICEDYEKTTARAQRRFDRLQQKYPGWTLVMALTDQFAKGGTRSTKPL